MIIFSFHSLHLAFIDINDLLLQTMLEVENADVNITQGLEITVT